MGDDGRSFADGGGHPLGRAGADIADCEHARQARLQRERRLRRGRRQPGQDVAVLIEREASIEPCRIWFGADEHET